MYLPKNQGNADFYKVTMNNIEAICKQQHAQGGVYMIYANESAANWHDIERDERLPKGYRSSAPRACCLGVISSADGSKVKSDINVLSNRIVELDTHKRTDLSGFVAG